MEGKFWPFLIISIVVIREFTSVTLDDFIEATHYLKFGYGVFLRQTAGAKLVLLIMMYWGGRQCLR
jgi:hypothetical protein